MLNKSGGWEQWLTSVIPALWEAKGGQNAQAQELETSLIVLATWEVELGRSLEPRRWRLQ